MKPAEHHKEMVSHLRTRAAGHFSAAVYRDDHGHRPVMVAEFGPERSRLYSTVGVCDRRLALPSGRYEFAACGQASWLPNALVSSVYWLSERSVENWPLVCEDVVRHNARSPYRHMAYVPSRARVEVSGGAPIALLLGVPIKDKEITLTLEDATERTMALFPSWLTSESQALVPCA